MKSFIFETTPIGCSEWQSKQELRNIMSSSMVASLEHKKTVESS